MKNKKYNTEHSKAENNKQKLFNHLWVLIFIVNSFAGYGFTLNDSTEIELDLVDTTIYGAFVDSNTLELKNKIIIFMEYEHGVVIDRIDLRTGEKKRVLNFNETDWENKKDSAKFRGHWSGIEFGINELVNADNTLDRPEGYGYLDLNSWRSWNLNVNFAQSTTPIIKDRLAMVGGLGFEFNHYRFQDENNIQRSETTGDIEERLLTDLADIRKSKFNAAYLTVPAILELQLGKGNSKDRYYLSFGVVGARKIASKVKVVYGEKGERKKMVEKGVDLNLNPWRLSLTARTGYKDFFDFFASYSLTRIFEKDKGPELYPVSFGLRMSFGD